MRCDYVDQRILITLQALADDESLIVVDHPRHPVDQPVDTELTQQAIALVHLCIGIDTVIIIIIIISIIKNLQMIYRRSVAFGSHLVAS